MNRSAVALLDEALALSHAMLARGSEGDWDDVVALEAQRKDMLRSAFAAGAEFDPVGVKQRVEEILALDKQLVSASIKARDAIASELSGFNRGRKAARAYGRVGASPF